MPDPLLYPNFPGDYRFATARVLTPEQVLAREAHDFYYAAWRAREDGRDLNWRALRARGETLLAECDARMLVPDAAARREARWGLQIAAAQIRRETQREQLFAAVTLAAFFVLAALVLLLVWANVARLRSAHAAQTEVRATYYTGSTGALADGSNYGRHARAGNHFVATNAWPLGTRLRLTCRGRSLTARVRDRIGHGTRLDLAAHTARALDPDFRRIGRLPVRVRVLSLPARSQRRGAR